MAESFPSSIATNMLTEIDFLTSPETRLSSGVRSEIMKIKRILCDVKDVLLNATAQAQERELQNGLAKLSKLMYDAEDLLDELKCEILARKVSKLNCVRFFLKIKLTRRSLDEMADTIKSIYEKNKKRRVYSREMVMNHTLVSSSEVFGRDSDKRKIIDILMKPNKEGERVDVIPIVGLGGLGKTTLAKQVYNEKTIDEHFDLKMWVSVPADFDMIKLMKEAYSSATGQTHVELEADELENRLLEELVDKKFLLVLDDVWNNNSDRWENLKILFMQQQAYGSKIVVTTRSKQVAELTAGTAPGCDLKCLSHNDCKSLFLESAFREEKKKANPELIEIGGKIAEKCGGNPLVVKILGTLLYQNTNMSDWSLIKDSVITVQDNDRNSILSALKLSYDHLPPHLQRCLAYCALFPRGNSFNSDYLICDWMAHGFLATAPTENEDLEGIGLQYLKELFLRCFFQEIIEDYGDHFTFKMHNLIYNVVAEVAQKDCKMVDLRILDADVDALHLYFLGIGNGNKKIPFASNNLRTFFMKGLRSKHVGDSFVNRWISSFKHLRQLCLSGLTFEVLPDSVSALKHLRFLDLSWNLKLNELSDDICKLLSLQTLRLMGCPALKKLPSNIPNMVSLRYLEITTQEPHLPENGIECLSSLRSLGLYKCGNLESLPEGMQRLTHLRKLILQDCDKLKSLPDDIKHLKRLKELVICNCKGLNMKMDLQGEDLLNLEYMRIEAFDNLTTLPAWLSNLTSLQKLDIVSCPKLSSLPDGMQNLTNLKELKIRKSPTLSESCRQNRSNISHVPEIHLDPAVASSCCSYV